MIKRLALFLIAALLSTAATATDLSLDGVINSNSGTATASAGAATLNNKAGVITSETLSTLPGSSYTLTLTNSVATVGDIVLATVSRGTITNGNVILNSTTVAAGSVVFIISNGSPTANNAAPTATTSNVWGGTLTVRYFIIKP